ncbi:hypothetical protein DERP_003012 [Dermatophagoides pteronyssinus]|uniref:Uncharacterized protein n=1 Tax=Dermatophagoides pteronyssinus TaxID=6956 RepID=A0ABQ8JIS1_DERPT|nr:hypothetical protein DERP_003012 [Dermatophagoides pteronyssinus]
MDVGQINSLIANAIAKPKLFIEYMVVHQDDHHNSTKQTYMNDNNKEEEEEEKNRLDDIESIFVQ